MSCHSCTCDRQSPILWDDKMPQMLSSHSYQRLWRSKLTDSWQRKHSEGMWTLTMPMSRLGSKHCIIRTSERWRMLCIGMITNWIWGILLSSWFLKKGDPENWWHVGEYWMIPLHPPLGARCRIGGELSFVSVHSHHTTILSIAIRLHPVTIQDCPCLIGKPINDLGIIHM